MRWLLADATYDGPGCPRPQRSRQARTVGQASCHPSPARQGEHRDSRAPQYHHQSSTTLTGGHLDSHDRLIWAAFAAVAVLVTITGLVVFGSIFFAPGSDATVKQMIEGRIISRALVLFLIVPTIALLCLQDRISGEAALAALSAIAGYILGGSGPGQ